MEAVPAAMGGMAVMAEPVVGPVVGDGSVVPGMEHLTQECGGVAMATLVGQATADPTIGMDSMITHLTHRCCVIQMQIVRHEVPDLGANMERVIYTMGSARIR